MTGSQPNLNPATNTKVGFFNRLSKPKPDSLTPVASPPPPDSTDRVRMKFDSFLESLGNTLLDITALEVNTMVVAQITGSKFNPEEAYVNLYEIPERREDGTYEEQYFVDLGMKPRREIKEEQTLEESQRLQDRYLSLRRKLNLEYNQVVSKLTTDPDLLNKLRLNEPRRFEELKRRPPDPDPIDADERKWLGMLFRDPQFLRSLRKLSELKAALDSDKIDSPRTDIIFAQTVIQLDGDVINRYHQELLTHEQRELIIKIHSEGVVTGEKQWHGLLNFMVSLVQSIASPRSANGVSFPPNGQKPPSL
jgi:hypothetical protein